MQLITCSLAIYIRFDYYVVIQSGEVSNFLIEDFDAVTKFINAESRKKGLRL